VVTARFKSPHFQQAYENCRVLAADPQSVLYVQKTGLPNTGNAHGSAYWHGRRGAPAAPLYIRGSLAYCLWRAGADDFKAAKSVLPKGLMPYSPPKGKKK
jgi:hypothetical protein